MPGLQEQKSVQLSSALANRAMGSLTVRINQLKLIRRARHASTISFSLATGHFGFTPFVLSQIAL